MHILNILLPGLEQAVLFFPLALGIYISYSILKLTDMTVDGTFVLGAGVFARVLTDSGNPYISFILAICAGAIAGVGVSMIQNKNKVDSLVAGILALFMLYSINFQVMQTPNINLLGKTTVLTQMSGFFHMPVWVCTVIIVSFFTLALGVFLYTRFGLLLCAFGSNNSLLSKLGRNIEFYRSAGLAMGNALAAMCGALTSQMDGYADINMGFGMALTGIGSVIIGQHILRFFVKRQNRSIMVEILGCFLGVYLYFCMLNLFLYIGVNPINLKLFLGLILVVSLRTASNSKSSLYAT